MKDIKQISEHSYAATAEDGRVYTISNRVGDDFSPLFWRLSSDSWESMPASVAGEQVAPFGPDNLLPGHIREIIGGNNLAPGVLDRQHGLIFGQGLFLYKLRFQNGEIVKEWVNDLEIEAWLKSWDAVKFAKSALTDYLYLRGFFNSYHLERGYRIGRPARIAKLKHIPATHARLEWPSSGKAEDVKYIITGDFEHQCIGGTRRYPLFDEKNPAKHSVSAAYNNSYSFGRTFYSIPQYWGALRWLIRGSEIPTIFKYVTDNGLNLAYHIHSPQAYWDNKRQMLRQINPECPEAEIEKKISDITKQLLDNLTEVLAGKENAGKFFHTVDFIDDMGKTVSWQIDPIDQKIKDFVDSQLKISEAASSAITSGMGLRPALSNLIINGKLASGSELLYAYKLFLSSDTEIPESTVLGPINKAIEFNFPGKGIRAGFYHRIVHTEEATSTANRMKNQ